MKEKLLQSNFNLRQQKIVNLLNKKRSPAFSNLSTESNRNKFIVIKNATISSNYIQQKNQHTNNNEQNINKNKRKIFSTNKNPNFNFKYFIDDKDLYIKKDINDFKINKSIANSEKEKNSNGNVNNTNSQQKEQINNQSEIKDIPKIFQFENKPNILIENNDKNEKKNNNLNNNTYNKNITTDDNNTTKNNNLAFFGNNQNIDKLPENSTKNNTNNNTPAPLTAPPTKSLTNLNPPNFTVTIENSNNNYNN